MYMGETGLEGKEGLREVSLHRIILNWAYEADFYGSYASDYTSLIHGSHFMRLQEGTSII
jgi:hypothetical protein